jgi:hypothetical protein
MSTRRHRFGPRAVEVAHFMRALHMTPGDDVLAALAEINCCHPSLTFRDFWGAAVLAQALAMNVEGHA